MRTFIFPALLTTGLITSGNAQNNESVTAAIGTQNQVYVTQSGLLHHSTVYQNGINGPGQQNLTVVQQENLDAFFSNESSVKQFGSGHESTVLQKGDNNAEIRIGTSSVSNTGNSTFAGQGGNGNAAYQYIFGADATHTSLNVRQYVENNYANQLATESRNSIAEGIQSGHNNTLEQLLEGSGNGIGITQVGDLNVSYQWIEGYNSADNSADIGQYGNENYAAVKITGSQNSFTSAQHGNSNTITGNQTIFSHGAAGQQGDRNLIRASQFGNANSMNLNQTGNDNDITGADPFPDAIQIGNDNGLEVLQSGNSNRSGSYQILNHNTAGILQTGQLHLSVLKQTGLSNITNVIQGN